MHILILTPAYHPQIHPRAHRWTALAEHWAAQGHRVRVVCARKQGFRAQEVYNGVQVYRCGFESLQAVLYFAWPDVQRRGRVGEQPGKSGLLRRMAEWIYQSIWKQIYFPDDALFWIRPAERLSRRLVEEAAPDVVISVSLPFSAHVAGLFLKRRYPSLHWLADIGDPYAIQCPALFNRHLYSRLARKLEKKVLETADQVVVTNPALREALLAHYQPSYPERIRVIPPLLRHLPTAVPYRPVPGKIRLVYAGSLYPGLREPREVLHWLDSVLKMKPDWQNALELHWYGDIAPEFYTLLASRPWIQLLGLRPREEVQCAMAGADLLVHIGNRSTFQLPSKVVDYLAAGRPVLHFQYADPDPFVDFWPLPDNLFVISNADTARQNLDDAIRFIENTPMNTPEENVSDSLQQWLPDHLGDIYLDI
jgi:glycosyltransferase involved in cell wall biosynthesis